MKLDCRRCGAPIAVPPEATVVPNATLVCPGCGARYVRRSGAATGAAVTVAPSATGSALESKPPQTAPRGSEAPPTSPPREQSVPGSASSVIGHPTVAIPATDPTQFRAGDRVAGRYVVRRFIARGGMGEVYEAEDAELRQTVALKTVHPREAGLELAVERFKREIHLARRVTHPNVCRIYDVGFHTLASGDSVIFLSMELLEGETLAQLLKSRGALAPEEALPLVLQMADALIAAHAAGVVHRDFKSENVFLVPSAEGTRVVVTDFGVARGVEYDEFAARVTVVDAAVGTPAYMAPEQIEGAAITPAIDQYAFGVVLFEMLTGQLPFAGDTPIATAVKRLTQAAPAADELKPGLELRWVEVIRRCLARRPEDRFESIRQVREAVQGAPLERPAAGASGAVAPTPRTAVGAGTRRRRQLWLLAAVTIALGFALTHGVLRVRKSLASPFANLSGVERRAVAVVPFRNLTQREEFEWLSVALAEMVASEIRTTKGLRALSGESVARAGVDLELGRSDELSAEELERIRSRLGADYVVAGSFAVLGSGADANVRLAVRVEDARSRETVGETVESGTEQQLFELVGRTGERLRELLGGSERGVEVDPGAVTPKGARAARLYSEGLLKLRAFEPQAALELLQQAREAEPLNPMIRAALAGTWAALGFEQRAREEAEEALRMGTALPAEERFAVDALAAELRRDWPRAGQIWAQLWNAFPDNLDYGLKLSRAQLEGGQSDLALATLASLRELPEPDGTNPRIDLAEAAAAGAVSDFARQLAASGRAAARAGQLGAPLLIAEARVREAEALRRLGRPVEAEAATASARALYRGAGDRVGEAAALTILAGALFDRGDLPAARSANEEALASYREAGDRNGVARTLNGLAVLSRNLGDPAAARKLYVEAMSVLSEIDDRRGLAYTQNNLSAVAAEEGLLSEARAAADSAFAVLSELGDRSGAADALLNLGVIEHRLGSLDSAKGRLLKSLELKRELSLLPGEGAALVALADLEVDRGELVDSAGHLQAAVALGAKIESPTLLSNAVAVQGVLAIEGAEFELARQRLEEALALRSELGRAGKVDESRVLLARLAIESGEPRAALAQLDAVLAERPAFRPALLANEVALFQSRALAALGRPSEARKAFERARDASQGSENPRLGYLVATAAAAIERSGGGRSNAEAALLDQLAADARQRKFELWAAELEILRARWLLKGDPGAAVELNRLAADCAKRGFARLERLATDSAN